MIIFNKNEFDEVIDKYKINKNLSIKAQLKQLLKIKYQGKLLNAGNIYDVFFSRDSVKEYVYPANRRITQDVISAKKDIATELRQLLIKAKYIDTKDNVKINDGSQFDYFAIEFGIKDKKEITIYKGVLNIKISNRGRPTFYDITKIKKAVVQTVQRPHPLLLVIISQIKVVLSRVLNKL